MSISKKFNPHFMKINSEWIIHLYIKCKTMKLLEENIGKYLGELEFAEEFLHTTPKV